MMCVGASPPIRKTRGVLLTAYVLFLVMAP